MKTSTLVQWVLPSTIMVACIGLARFTHMDAKAALILGWVGGAVSCLAWFLADDQPSEGKE